MDTMQLMRLAGAFGSLRLSSPDDDFKPVLQFLGVDPATGANLLSMLRLQSKEPDQLFSEFMKEGGLMRALASPQKRIEKSFTPISCPHCAELIVLN
jgi:hypothetical protein